MAFTVQMPALGESVTEGTVTRWLKQEGDRVEVDEPLLEVSTDKVDTEIPSPAAGVLERIVAGEDETVEVGGDLAVIGDGDGGGGAGGVGRPGRAAGRRAAPRTRRRPRTSRAERVGRRAAVREPGRRAGRGRRVGHGAGRGHVGQAGWLGRVPGGSGTPVTMPELGESVTEGTVTRWLKEVGDTVEVDEPLLEVSTDKVDTEIPSPVAGTLLSITVGEDETVQVGAELAVVGDPGQASQDQGRLGGRPGAGRVRAGRAAEPAPEQEAPDSEAGGPQAGGSQAGRPQAGGARQDAEQRRTPSRSAPRPPTVRAATARQRTTARRVPRT